VNNAQTADSKVYQIIKILTEKSNLSYQHFIEILKEEDQKHIVLYSDRRKRRKCFDI